VGPDDALGLLMDGAALILRRLHEGFVRLRRKMKRLMVGNYRSETAHWFICIAFILRVQFKKC